MIETKEFTDMYLIAALLSYGFELVDLDRSNVNRQTYNFDNKETTVYVITSNGEVVAEIADLFDVKRYYSARTLLYPGSYPDVLKDLKQEIISYRNDKK